MKNAMSQSNQADSGPVRFGALHISDPNDGVKFSCINRDYKKKYSELIDFFKKCKGRMTSSEYEACHKRIYLI